MTTPVRLDDLISLVRSRRPDGSPLDDLGDAVDVGAHLGEVADHLVGHFVDQARRAGASWTEIGRHMGVTKQAVQKRFVPRADVAGSDDVPHPTDASSFTRFTPRARRAVAAAEGAARRWRQVHIQPAHLVLGVLTEADGLAMRTLTDLEVDPVELAHRIEAGLLPVDEEPGGHVPFGGPAKKALDLTFRAALRLGHPHVGTEHLLLGVLADDTLPVTRLLADLGATAVSVEARVTLGAPARDRGVAGP